MCGTCLFCSHTFITFPCYPTGQTYLPAYDRGIQCVSLILGLAFTISSGLSLIQTSANGHLNYCIFYWRNCNGDGLLMFGKQCIYLPVFLKVKASLLAYSSWIFNSRSCDWAPSPACITSCTFSLQIDKMAGIQLTDLTTMSLI